MKHPYIDIFNKDGELDNRKKTFLNSPHHPEHLSSFKNGTELLDKKRNMNLLQVIPELENFWKACVN